MKAKKIHPADIAHAERIKTAVAFSAYLRLSPFEVLKQTCSTQAEAEAAASEMNKKSLHGRRAIVYAITPEGWSICV